MKKLSLKPQNIYSEYQCHEDLQMTKVMQKFQETGLANASSMRPVNLNKPLPNTFKKISTQAD